MTDVPRVAVVGGGLAGLAAASALAEQGVKVELFETRRQLGGRAGSFVDSVTGEQVDNCQHVSMGCCTNLAQFAHRVGIYHHFRRFPTLHFFGPDGSRSDFRGTRGLPAPLHLADALMRLRFLTWPERLSIGLAMMRLARATPQEQQMTMNHWLEQVGQTSPACQNFWSVVLVSALSETLPRIAVAHARKVFVDGFMAHPAAYEMYVPDIPLGQLYGDKMLPWFEQQGIKLHLGARVETFIYEKGRVTGLSLVSGQQHPFEAVVCAVPWKRVGELCTDEMQKCLPQLARLNELESATITSVHLWFDRETTHLPHAVLVGRLSQWLFRRSAADDHYYQVVISAAHQLAQLDRETLVAAVCGELKQVWPDAQAAQLKHWRVVKETSAVFSPLPGVDQLRPPQTTSIPNFFLAGDWTRTGWPATMEGAARSGHLAAQAVLHLFGKQVRCLADNLPKGWIMNCWTGEK